jgi:hypothetical protein
MNEPKINLSGKLHTSSVLSRLDSYLATPSFSGL